MAEKKYMGKTCGMCGNYDGYELNEFVREGKKQGHFRQKENELKWVKVKTEYCDSIAVFQNWVKQSHGAPTYLSYDYATLCYLLWALYTGFLTQVIRTFIFYKQVVRITPS